MKIVESGYKLDLHIHSCYSSVKDGSKVAFNTIDNMNILVEKLAENEVQLCAITDHDAFNYDIYQALKSYEKMPDCPIVKVFPGIEFSVEFQGDSSFVVIHIVAIFDDQDDVKIKRISTVLNNESGKPKIESLTNNLGKIKLENVNEESNESLLFTGKVNTDKNRSSDLGAVVSSIDHIIEELRTISENPTLTIEDKEELKKN